MPAQTTNLFLLQDLENSSRTGKLADTDLSALRIVADWIETFVAESAVQALAQELGRTNWRRLGLKGRRELS